MLIAVFITEMVILHKYVYLFIIIIIIIIIINCLKRTVSVTAVLCCGTLYPKMSEKLNQSGNLKSKSNIYLSQQQQHQQQQQALFAWL